MKNSNLLDNFKKSNKPSKTINGKLKFSLNPTNIATKFDLESSSDSQLENDSSKFVRGSLFENPPKISPATNKNNQEKKFFSTEASTIDYLTAEKVTKQKIEIIQNSEKIIRDFNYPPNYFEPALTEVTEAETRQVNKVFTESFTKQKRYSIIASYQQPNIVLIENFLSQEECQAVIDYAKPQLQSSAVVGRDNTTSSVSARRTSEGMHLADPKWTLKNIIEKRIAEVTNIDLAQGEFINVLRYLPGQQNRAHFDYFMPQRPSSREYATKEKGGQRMATFIIYLNTVASGGETEFTLLGLKVSAIQGQALYFSYTENGSHDLRSLHAGLPPLIGEKWVAVQFIRQCAIANKQIVGYV